MAILSKYLGFVSWERGVGNGEVGESGKAFALNNQGRFLLSKFSHQSETTQDKAISLKIVDKKLWLRTTALNYQFNGEGGI